MKPEILDIFYRSIIENMLTGSIMVWFDNMPYDDRNSLSRVIRTAGRLTGVDLSDLREFFDCRVKSRFNKVIAEPSHPAFTFIELLLSGKRYRSLGYSGMSSRTSYSLYPTAVRVLNDVGPSLLTLCGNNCITQQLKCASNSIACIVYMYMAITLCYRLSLEPLLPNHGWNCKMLMTLGVIGK